MKIQLVFFSFIVLSTLQWIPADGQRKTGSVSYHQLCILSNRQKAARNLFFFVPLHITICSFAM